MAIYEATRNFIIDAEQVAAGDVVKLEQHVAAPLVAAGQLVEVIAEKAEAEVGEATGEAKFGE